MESCVPTPGFLPMVASGHPILFAAMNAQPGVEAVERLVETMQAEMWSGRVPADDLIALYEQTCAARGHDAVSVSAPLIAAIRTRIDTLTARWTALTTGETLTLDFEARPIPNR